MLEKKRVVLVKSPKLRKIRSNFRRIILLESKKRLKDLLDKEAELLHREASRTSSYNEILRSINKQKNALRIDLRNSIVVCDCGDIEGDRVFNPRDKIWYCLECFEILEKSYKKELKAMRELIKFMN